MGVLLNFFHNGSARELSYIVVTTSRSISFPASRAIARWNLRTAVSFEALSFMFSRIAQRREEPVEVRILAFGRGERRDFAFDLRPRAQRLDRAWPARHFERHGPRLGCFGHLDARPYTHVAHPALPAR